MFDFPQHSLKNVTKPAAHKSLPNVTFSSIQRTLPIPTPNQTNAINQIIHVIHSHHHNNSFNLFFSSHTSTTPFCETKIKSKRKQRWRNGGKEKKRKKLRRKQWCLLQWKGLKKSQAMHLNGLSEMLFNHRTHSFS